MPITIKQRRTGLRIGFGLPRRAVINERKLAHTTRHANPMPLALLLRHPGKPFGAECKPSMRGSASDGGRWRESTGASRKKE
jgi:hypothetical protein